MLTPDQRVVVMIGEQRLRADNASILAVARELIAVGLDIPPTLQAASDGLIRAINQLQLQLQTPHST